MHYIELSDVTFAYAPDEPAVFCGFSFFAKKGECVIVRGDNGTGKSTLFRLLNGLSFPQKGRFMFDGEEITAAYLKDNRNAKGFHKRIGYLFQNADIMLFNGKVYDEVAFGPRQMGLPEADVKQRTEDCLALFDIMDLSDKAPYHLSGGQKKKVAFAAVLSLSPDVVILDEPFAGLDRKTAAQVVDLLYSLKKSGKTIILATHLDEMPDDLYDRVVCL